MKIKNYFFLLITLIALSCSQRSNQFETIDPSESNIHFSNRITESDSFNILEFEYIYNGGGIGIGDFNNDGLEDIFAAGNMVENALYLNQGGLKFEDISNEAQISSSGQWSSGVAVVDINADGWQDIYITNTTSKDSVKRQNNLYINKGPNENGIPVFSDEAYSFGLDDDSYSVNSAFFDYDNDGDLDVIIIINEMGDTRFHSQFRNQNQRGYYQRIDKLFRHDISDQGQHHFVNVSDQAGINIPGFSLGVNISDINKDGWKDIYISNDFLSDDLIYMNQKDGTFKEMARELLKHTSHSAMGNDVVDLNNDGFDEIVALDMFPETNYRQKRLLGETNYNTYLNNERFGYSYQYVRNSLQLNNGISPDQNPEYSEISLMAGMSSTDWSWTPLIADFDHDGYRDLIVTNGFPKDVTDHDFIDFKADSYRFASKELMLSRIPSIKAHNYAFKGNGISFEDVTDDWGFQRPGYSNGAAYGDLDNDGDLDIVINNINDSLTIMKNNQNAVENSGNYLNINLKGTNQNLDAIGTQIIVKHNDETLFYEHSIFRGYLSSYSKKVHFGLGNHPEKIELKVVWPDQSYHQLKGVSPNQTLNISYADDGRELPSPEDNKSPTLMTLDPNFDHRHIEDDFIDYNIQPLLPHKLSQYGPALTVGDINNDGTDDIYVSGSAFFSGHFLIQQSDGSFNNDTLTVSDPANEESGALIFDANGDGKNDLFISSGSYEHEEGSNQLKDKLYISKNGKLQYDSTALPKYLSNALNIKGADFDADGDIDLFIGGRVRSGNYPEKTRSYILENQSTSDKVSFIISDKLPTDSLGMVTDAVWTDFNDDGKVDLIVTRELDELLFLKNNENGFTAVEIAGTTGKKGLWNSITASDLDKDGDVDYVLGNIGLNTYFPITEKYPYRIYVNDFDGNGSTDALPFVFAKEEDGSRREYPFCSRMDFAKEINSIRKMLPSYDLYAKADINTLITSETLKKTNVHEANYAYSAILWNEGNLDYNLSPLPNIAQIAPVFGTAIEDIDNDGIKDILLIGNDYGNELIFGRMDALNGLVLKGKGDGTFEPLQSSHSGFYVPDDGKALVKTIVNEKVTFISSSNKGKIRKHDLNAIKGETIRIPQNIFTLTYSSEANSWAQEMPIGNGFLSQSSRIINVPNGVSKILGTDYQGKTTIIYDKENL
ncbi:MAG: VCBS repeat-containing protein [Saprospiraceae bacterium]|nr:VCBS repeat-containing protein [Saprospiraceae bacterium]